MGAASLAAGALALRGDLAPLVQHIPEGPAIAALFRRVPMPGGAVPILRPPAETRPALTQLIAAAPRDAMLYRLRAQQAETALDFAAAEADWKSYAREAPDRYAAQVEFADFYARRARPRDEIAILTAATAAKDDPLLPAGAQPAWRAFERMAAVVERDRLPALVAAPVFRAWVSRYPKEPDAWRKRIAYLSAHGQYAAAQTEITRFGRNFQDEFEPVRMRADLEMSRGAGDAALAQYDRAFQPLWPEGMRANYFKLLESEGRLRDFAGRARTALAANPADLDATARLFHYFRAQNNVAAARRALLEYRLAKESSAQPWTPGELETMAQLFAWLPDVNEAARLYYALYSVPPAVGAHAERALYGLADLLLTAADQPIQFGSGDLSLYKDIATVDPSPGFLNGILSLLLNWTSPRSEYQNQNEKSAAYFHRAAAAQLYARLERQYPRSQYRAPLLANLVSAYGAYGDDAALIRAGRAYLAAFPSGSARVPVAMQVSDALARGNRADEELALYDQLLRELAARSAGVPVGAQQAARSGEYVQVLDKYLSRLVTLGRPLDAMGVYRAELDRNPNDPGLYQRFAAYLEQANLSRDVEDVYAKAIAKFADRSWYHRLARWYLRTRQSMALSKISRDAVAVFSGTELEQYFEEVVTQAHPDAGLYLELNLYAHERFPADLYFVRNLLGAYARRETADPASAGRLLRQYWFYDAELRGRFFEELSARGRLYPELAEVRAANPSIANGQPEQAFAVNPAAVQFAAEAEAWLSHFEAAAPAERALASAYPGNREFSGKASALYRSLAAFDPHNTEIALSLAANEQRANPQDPAILARMGDILADRELFGRARTYWDRMPAAQPNQPDAYLDAATVYWDYYRYEDALRWIASARRKFDDPALFAYQAGAIYEGKRDYRKAVPEYLAGALAGADSSRNRLLRLLSKAQTQGLVDRATATAVAADPSTQAVSLRIAVLEARQRRPEIETLLKARVEAEKSATELRSLEETARRLGFDAIQDRASERLAGLSSDPVDRMRLTLAHAHLLESKKDVAGAARVVDALYHDHPLILGVVRGAVDLHARNGQPDAAIVVLLESSKRARADLGAQFVLEAARIATTAGQIDRARSLLAGLLAADAVRTEYLAAMAGTYLQAKDDRGFRDYQLAAIQRLKQSPLTLRERVDRIASIRRSLIPALDRLQDSAGAVDQYIEVINSYPEDESLTKEAAAYAIAHAQAPRLVAFYRKTVNDAPLDYRWPVVLARIETVTEDYPAAIADYERGIKARPDRGDLLEAKGRLEERLMRFDDAIKGYSRLYELSYRDPQWMVKVGELRARSGQDAAAVAALKTAIIGARSETADADFAIAEQLETWHILPDAVAFAERGAAAADLSKDGGKAVILARILTRARRFDTVLSRLGSNPEVDPQVVPAVAKIVGETYTPEEKSRFEQALRARTANVSPETRTGIFLPLAQGSGLAELESQWRLAAMSGPPYQVDPRFVALQSQRGLYGELGRQLEEYAGRNPGRPVEATALAQAAEAFFAEGDADAQLRLMQKALARNALSGALLDRYLSMAAARRPDDLLAVVRGGASAEMRNRAVQFAIGGNRAEEAYAAIRTRGAAMPPVWTKAYTALAGQYFDDHAPAIDAAFQGALDTRTIGERIRNPLKPDAVIVGSVWFYYGASYGEYLAAGKSAGADSWMATALEGSPGSADAHLALGDAYANLGQGAKAIVQYGHVLELDGDRGDAESHIARVLWSEGRRPEAIAHWKSALAIFLQIQSRGIRVPEPFWDRVAATFTDIGERHALGEMRGDIAHLLGDYYQRNGEYRLHELIEPAAGASLVSGQGTEWLLELGRSMADPQVILSTLIRTAGLTTAQRISLQRDLAAIEARNAEAAFGDRRQNIESQANSARVQLVSMLLDAGDVTGAAAEFRKMPPMKGARTRWSDEGWDDVEIRVAAKSGALDTLLARYRSQPEAAPFVDSLQKAAVALRSEGEDNAARAVLEFLYDRELRDGHLAASNFLGLAEVKLQRNDPAAAVALLNRMALVLEDGFDTLAPAAELLAKYAKSAEAADFLRRRVRAVPWDAEAKVQLARTLPAGTGERATLLTAAVMDGQSGYPVRAAAARMALSQPVAGVAGTELALLSSPTITPDAAGKPFQVEARIEAARAAFNPEVKLRLFQEALELAPADDRARSGALRAALAVGRDRLALSLERSTAPAEEASYLRLRQVEAGRAFARAQTTDLERAALAEALAAAAERIDDLPPAQSHLAAAIELRPQNDPQRAVLVRKRVAIAEEQNRRATNAARQPSIRDAIEQDHAVWPRISRSAQ